MAKFSQTFLQGLLQPTYQQGLFDVARSVGQAPALMRQQEQRQQREKGMMGGTLAAQQAAAEGRFDPETMKSYMGSMQGLGVSQADIMKTLPDLQATNQAAVQKKKSMAFVSSMGPEYVALSQAGFKINDIYNKFLEDGKQDSIVSLVQQIDPTITSELAAQMTSKDVVALYNTKKEEGGTQKWLEWQETNPEITDENRQLAIQAAASAFGADAPKKVADLEATQLNNKAKKKGETSTPVLITMEATSAFAGLDALSGTKQQITVKNLPIDANGKLTKEAEKWLENHAVSAMVQNTGQGWESTSVPAPEPTPETTPDNPTSPTLNQLAPGLVKSLTDTQL
jgi:hypothetical protein